MPLPHSPVISCFTKIQIGLTYLVPAYPGCAGKEAIKRVSDTSEAVGRVPVPQLLFFRSWVVVKNVLYILDSLDKIKKILLTSLHETDYFCFFSAVICVLMVHHRRAFLGCDVETPTYNEERRLFHEEWVCRILRFALILHNCVWQPCSTQTRWGSLQRPRPSSWIKGEAERERREDAIPYFPVFWPRPWPM